MKISWLTLENLDSMVEIIHQCRQVMNLQAELAWSRDSISKAMDTGKVLGALQDQPGERLMGFVLFMPLGPEPAVCLEIWCLATHPEFQGQGVMGRLLKEAQQLAPEIWLEVHERNQYAIGFYKNKGFQQVGIRKRYYEDGGDAWLFSWKDEKHEQF